MNSRVIRAPNGLKIRPSKQLSDFLPSSSLARENPLTRDFTIFMSLYFSKPAISPSVPTVDEGVQGPQAIISLLPYIPNCISWGSSTAGTVTTPFTHIQRTGAGRESQNNDTDR